MVALSAAGNNYQLSIVNYQFKIRLAHGGIIGRMAIIINYQLSIVNSKLGWRMVALSIAW